MVTQATINVLIISLVLFLFSVCLSATALVLTLLMVEQECNALGIASDKCSGSVEGQRRGANNVSIFTLVQGCANLLSCPAVGAFADSFGRKPALMMCLLSICSTCLSLALVEDLWVLVFINSFLGLCGGPYVFFGTCFAVAADLSAQLSLILRMRLFSTVESCLWLGLLCGPPLGGELVKRFGARDAFYGLAIPPVVGMALVLVVYRETLLGCRAFEWRRANPLGALHLMTTHRISLTLSIMCLFSLAGMNGGISVLPLYSQKLFGWNSEEIGLLESLMYASSAAGLAFILPLLSQKVGAKWLCVLSVAWATITWFVAGLCRTGMQLYVTVGCFAMNGIYFPVLRTAVTTIFGAEMYGLTLGAVATMQTLAYAIAPAVFNHLYGAVVDLQIELPGIFDNDFGPRLSSCFVPAFSNLLAVVAALSLPKLESLAHPMPSLKSTSLVSSHCNDNLSSTHSSA